MSGANVDIAVPEPVIVSLKQVAAWDLDYLNAPCIIKASLPALQRGLVWSPQQVELLWDSILRGFPIGSLVVSKKIQNQERAQAPKTGVTHHLLDGQQRANAITLGFHDPFSSAMQVRGNKSESILWLDLAPRGTTAYRNDNLATTTTRQFLTRVTTRAHPWGYRANDDASPISASDARYAGEWEYENRTALSARPRPIDLFPLYTNAPVPMAWLMAAADEAQGEEQCFWRLVESRLAVEAPRHRWPQLALDHLREGTAVPGLHAIYTAIMRTMQTRLVVLEAPKNLIDPSEQETSVQNQNTQDISSIEQLFNRLNSKGTRLEGEELAYSMIKAYWPGIADIIESVPNRRFPASTLVALGVRAALIAPRSGKLERALTIPRLRAIANAMPPKPGELPSSAYKQRTQIESFFGIGLADPLTSRLVAASIRVDKWLVYAAESPNGLPPVLLSSFARGSSDVYLVFLHIADRLHACGNPDDAQWMKMLPGVATLIHWFAQPGETPAIADLLINSIAEDLSSGSLCRGVKAALDEKLIIKPRDPEELAKFIGLPDDADLAVWRWWHSLIGFEQDETKREHLHQSWWLCIDRTYKQKELLLFAQRAWLNRRFPDYDPSRRDLWDGHNRPWDFDHIHASYYFAGKKGPYGHFCREWGNCIGNLRAWPFEENRSDEKKTARQKLEGKPDQQMASLITEAALDAFSSGDEARHVPSKARVLCEAIKDRYIRIYRDWYDSAGVSQLLERTTEK